MKNFLTRKLFFNILSIIFSFIIMTQNSSASGPDLNKTNSDVGKETIETKLKKAASNAVIVPKYLGMILKESVEDVLYHFNFLIDH